jgi:hypothetical protein
MRKIFTHGPWLIDLALFQRDSFYLHLFFISIVKAKSWQIKTPDLKLRVRRKAMPLPIPFQVIERMDGKK